LVLDGDEIRAPLDDDASAVPGYVNDLAFTRKVSHSIAYL